ncbi:protein HEXIM1-like [Ambystoma mexicanum]|uniref:protein HEXIM1-like n=1 Tax=Ambystoma mexicanum TaxID=8296 RepID=UPI0037E85CCD
MEQPELSDNCQTSPVSAGGGGSAHARRMELDGGWRCEDTTEEDCHRAQSPEKKYHREETRQEDSCHREEEREYHRAQERDQWVLQELDCARELSLWPEQNSTWQHASVPQGGGGLDETFKLPGGGEKVSCDAAPPTVKEWKGGVGTIFAGDGWDRSAHPAPCGGGDDEWRKKKHRRRPSKKKRRWKPYFKLSWEEKQQLEERESVRAARLRAEMFAKGQPVAPYNTTQFLMEDHAQAEPDLRSGGGTESSEEEPPEEESEGPGSDGTGGPGSGLRPGGFLLKDFSETYERYHTESLQNMSKQQLVREYLELEKCLSRMEDENNRLRRQGIRVPHRHLHKDSHTHAGNALSRHHGAEPHPPTRGDLILPLREDPHYSDSDYLLRETPLQRHTEDNRPDPLPRGYPLQLPKGPPHPNVEPLEHPHPRIRELELELDRLRAQNTQLIQEKKENRLSNSYGD